MCLLSVYVKRVLLADIRFFSALKNLYRPQKSSIGQALVVNHALTAPYDVTFKQYQNMMRHCTEHYRNPSGSLCSGRFLKNNIVVDKDKKIF